MGTATVDRAAVGDAAERDRGLADDAEDGLEALPPPLESLPVR